MKKRKKIQLMDVAVYTVLTLITLIILYPLYFTVIASFSDPSEVISGNVFLWIKGFTLDSYKYVFESDEIWIGYRNSIFYTVFYTIFAMVLTIPAAYALSREYLWHRNLLTTFFVITMYFSGGMLPTYLNVRNLGLLDKPYTLIVIGAFSAYNMIVAKNYFQSSIPGSLYEAAEIDGCSEMGKFFRIGIPLAKPVIAVITLYYAVGQWNNYFNSLIYITKREYYSLQMILRSILLETKNALQGINLEEIDTESLMAHLRRVYTVETMKYSVILIASLPMLMIYPFIQKHFVKGVMIGAVKG